MPQNAVGQEFSSFKVGKYNFHVPTYLQLHEPVGRGAYGIVCSATNKDLGTDVAVKKIEQVFDDVTFARRTLRELRILRQLKHENVLDIQAIFIADPCETFSDVYLVSTLMETDLTSILRSSQPLEEAHVQFFLYQILRGMKYLHSGGILHRDLKPRNLLVNSNCDLKIADFGLSRVEFTRQHLSTGPMTEYICTRWYRAPEILCSASSYGPPMDVWSIGCIFAELLSRQPLLPGKNTKHQLELTLKLLGLPSKREVQGIENPKCRQFIQSFENIVPQGGVIERLKDRLPAETPNSALELVARMLTFSADHRLSVNQAIQHAYVQDLYCPEDEPVLPGELAAGPFEFERRRTGAEGLRAEVYDEMLQVCTAEQRERYYRKHPRPDITRYPVLREGESVYDD